jgi:hypothetical protein
MKKIIKLTEADLTRIVKRVIDEDSKNYKPRWEEQLENITKYCVYLEDMEMMDEIYGLLIEKNQVIGRFLWNDNPSHNYLTCSAQGGYTWEITPKWGRKVIEFDDMVKMILELDD